MKKLTSKLLSVLVLSLAFVTSTKAQNLIQPGDCPPGTTCGDDFRQTVISYINYFLGFLGLAAVAVIIYAGVLMVTSAGDDEQTGKGKTIIMWAVIGIVIVLLAYSLVNFVLGVQQNAG